jgi:hypothetical protein
VASATAGAELAHRLSAFKNEATVLLVWVVNHDCKQQEAVVIQQCFFRDLTWPTIGLQSLVQTL